MRPAGETPTLPYADAHAEYRASMPPAKPTAWRILILAAALCVTPIILLSQILAHWRLDVVDDQMFAYFGWRIAHGATVYVDVWDNKPPGIYWINALGMLLSGNSYAGIAGLCAAALVIGLACFFVISASVYFRGAAAVATVLASFYISHGFYQGGANRTETFLVCFELIGVALYCRGCARDRWWKWYLAGAACGCAFLFKQVGLAAWGAMGLHTLILMALRDLPFWSGVRRCVLLTLGVVTQIAIASGLLIYQGAFDEMLYATFGFNRAYFSVGASSVTDYTLSTHLLWNHIKLGLTLPLLMAIAALIHASLWWLRPKLRPAEIERPLKALGPAVPRYLVLFVIWSAAAFFGAMISPHKFRHYLVPTMPPLLLIAAYLINVIQAEMNLLARLQHRAWATAAFVVMAYFALAALELQWEEVSQVWQDRDPHRVNGKWLMKPSDPEAIGARVAELTRPGDTLQCWGYMPGVYLAARRANVCRYTTTEKMGQVETAPEARTIAEEVEESLSAHPPVAFVISRGDYDWIKGRIENAPPAGPIGAWLASWLDEHYRRAASVADAQIFLRDDRYEQEAGVPR